LGYQSLDVRVSFLIFT